MATYGAVNQFSYDYTSIHGDSVDAGNIKERINLWLQQRQKLLSLYSSVEHTTVNVMERSSLCQQLVDYLAMGQFKIFADLESQDSSDATLRILNSMNTTTNNILDFADKYAITTKTKDFRNDLSKLGEDLADHLELEDRLVKHYQSMALAA